MKNTKITNILKEFQEGVDFTIENKEKIIFHSKEIVKHLLYQSKKDWFIEFVERLIPSTVCSYEENEKKWTLTFKSGNRKDNSQEIENQKNELIEEDVKDNKKQVDKSEESLNRHFIDNGDSLAYSVERKNRDEAIEETYIERNQKRREQELEEKKKEVEQQTQNQENSPDSNKQDQQTEEEDNQQNLSQKTDNKYNNKNVYYGIGIIGLIVLVISIVAFWLRKKKQFK